MPSPTLSPAARSIFDQAKLKLRDEAAAPLDVNRDGSVDGAEAKALVRVFDRDNSGAIDADEQRAVDHFVGDDTTLTGAETWLAQQARPTDATSTVGRELRHAEREAQAAGQALSTAQHEKFMAELAARRGLGLSTPEPTESAARLTADYARTGTSAARAQEVADRTAAIGADTAELGALKESLPQLEQHLARLDRKPYERDLAKAEAKLASYSQLHAQMPTKAAKEARVNELAAQREQVKNEIRDLKKVRPRAPVQDQLDALEDQAKSLYEAHREARNFSPDYAARRIRHYDKQVNELRTDIGARDELRHEVDHSRGRAAALTARIADNTAGLAQAEQHLETALRLEKQIPFAEVRDAHAHKVAAAEAQLARAEAKVGALSRESTNVKALLDQAQAVSAGARSTLGAKRKIERLTASLRSAQTAAQQSPHLQRMTEQLAKASAIQKLVQEGKLDADDVNLDKVRADIAEAQGALSRAAAGIEQRAGDLAAALEDPAVQAQLAKMSEQERAPFESAAHAALAPTEAGKAFYDKNIKPVIEGSPKADPFWKNAFDAGNKTQGMGLHFVRSYGIHIASGGGRDAVRMLDKAMQQSLGLNRAEMATVEKALSLVGDDGDLTEAQAFLKQKGGKLTAVADKLDKVGGAFGAVSGVIATVELIRDPSLKKSLEVASSAGDMAAVANLMKSNRALTNFSKVAGKFAPPLNLVLGSWNAYEAHQRGDTGAAVGNGMQGLGGAMALVGAGMSATGIGAAAGVPLAIAGGIVSGVGTLVDWVFGDSKTEAFLRKHAPEYMD